MRYYLELIIKAKSLIETCGSVFLKEQDKSDKNKKIYQHIFTAYQELEKAISELQK
jgi:hypothetical protein|tara:strand:- start:82 stop:249 length:168 start_codon:yes stop_codon:yes gene_type:complete